MTWLIALILVFLVLYLIPLRMVRLHRRGKLTASNFALTFAVGWCLALLILFYLGLAEVLLSKRDPLLTALGVIIAAVNFALGYPIARLFYRSVLSALLKRSSGK